MNYNFSGQEIGQEFCDLIKTNITISMRTAFIFSSNMTMISYFNIIINIIIITNPTLQLSLSALVIKFFYFLTTSLQNLFSSIVVTLIKILNCIFVIVCFKRLTKLIINTS